MLIQYAFAFAIMIFAGWTVSCREVDTSSPDQPAQIGVNSLRIGISGDYPPFSNWLPDEAEPTGFSVDLARAYAASQGRSVDWVRFRWPKLRTDLEEDRFDLALSGVTVRPDRSVAGRFSLPLTTSGAIVLVEAGSNLKSPPDLQRPQLAIAVNAGGHLERVARTLFTRARILPVDENEQVLNQLVRDGKSNSIEAVMTDTLEAPVWQARRPGLRAIGPLTHDRKAAWFPKASEADVREFDRWLLRAEATGLLAELRQIHGLPTVRTAGPAKALLASLDERLSLMTGVARAKRILGIAVEDRPREARVLEAAVSAVRRAAARRDETAPSGAAIRQLYRAQIEAAKWIQHDWLDSRGLEPTASGATALAAARADLDDRYRPALIFLGDRTATLVIATADTIASSNLPPIEPSFAFELVAQALSRHGLPEAHLHALHDALLGITNGDLPSSR
jgi:cyclohexadienyl dehydratase